ncbi:hypothetical protein ACFQ34_22545 [Pseudonocardia benzenivorans]|jgi:hypothetical protein|uniref:Uncharacterized protein n=2 Tax=Pseudonocardia TaxID=1847 RepID=F4CPI5_PSEUX|nr:hypothetical protein [Pseudonocardia dioxanivorans]AEA25102.1 hypothetical protein Psed_2902 [Pseudonocardia dioxanivorans CB1190]GJF06658.1 hypothetical protein PSD17_56050 [Pseudonocardia sp. D17]
MSLVAVLAGMPDLLERTLIEHAPDSRGQCRECRDSSGISAAWPCMMREMADEASDIRNGGLPGTYGGRHRTLRAVRG